MTFLERGYAATTMDSVAADAGVAVQTVYFVFHTKGDLLQAVYEHAVLGPDAVPPHLSDWWRAVEHEPAVDRAVELLVIGTMGVLARAAPLVWTVLGDEGARERYDVNEQLRRNGYEVLVRILSAKHPLRSGLTPERARDILLVLTGPQIYAQFVRDLEWSLDDVQSWMIAAVLQQVFGIA